MRYITSLTASEMSKTETPHGPQQKGRYKEPNGEAH